MGAENDFLIGMMELAYGQPVDDKLKRLSQKIPWARNWPEDKKAFWNAEAFMWQRKVERPVRDLISNKLGFLKGVNLDLGCGRYSYIPSVGFDLSEKMLNANDGCKTKIVGDVEKKLPFHDKEFDSVTAVFLLNYVNNYSLLFTEISRVLKFQGWFVMVLSAKTINEWQRQKEVNQFSAKKWQQILKKQFMVKAYQKENLWFFSCRKRKTY